MQSSVFFDVGHEIESLTHAQSSSLEYAFVCEALKFSQLPYYPPQ